MGKPQKERFETQNPAVEEPGVFKRITKNFLKKG